MVQALISNFGAIARDITENVLLIVRRFGRLLILALFSIALADAATAATNLIIVKDVRVSAAGDSTRIVFDLSQPANERVFSLSNPERVVIDIAGGRMDAGFKNLPSAQGVLKEFRAADHGNGVLRVVLDVSTAVTARSFRIDPADGYGHRLVLDLMAPAVKNSVSATAPTSMPPATSLRIPSQPQVVKSSPASGRDVVVAIDAGHGGEDPGASGRRGTHEKDVTLAIAKKLKERIDAEPGMRAVLTRDGDYFVPLRDRMVRARKHEADMFVSVHADAVRDRDVSGSSVYVLSAKGASDEASRWLAEQENAADLAGGVSLDDKSGVLASVLLDLSQNASMSASVEAAQKVLTHLDKVGDVLHPVVRQAGFVVLKSPDIPSMLVETAFISNPAEEAKLTNPREQQHLADAILAGVREYFYDNPPPGTRMAQFKARDQATARSEPRSEARSTTTMTVAAGGVSP